MEKDKVNIVFEKDGLRRLEVEHKGLRYNQGKLRYDLLHPVAVKGITQVITRGAQKYADRNWENGMSWSSVIASLKRHLTAIESGEDYDEETGLLHIDHVQCNAHFLSAYYKIYPQGDDRPHRYLSIPKIGLDIDEVLADWVGHWCKFHGELIPEFWNFDRHIKDKFLTLQHDKNFWLSIPKKLEPSELPFEPHCYITSRSIPIEWTEEWLNINGFPGVPVYSVKFGESKVDVARKSGIEIFVDDRYENFVELNKAGICTFLYDAPHNQRYNVGHKRIKSLKELI